PVAEACVAHHPNACAALAFAPRRSMPTMHDLDPKAMTSPMLINAGRRYGATGNGVGNRALTAMAAELGPREFRALWKSDLPFAESFQRARGESFDEWLYTLLTRGTEEHIGPLPPKRVDFALLLAIPACLLLGVLGVAKRGSFA
ncbi:MAG TPA: hypothetical protein VE967_13705, partial [Gemmatimonadaceae bacterium]|nr:hypothetical protein [Gemmatimonadaceae bacterium]